MSKQEKHGCYLRSPSSAETISSLLPCTMHTAASAIIINVTVPLFVLMEYYYSIQHLTLFLEQC
jgi:hypothetical protein